MGTVLAARLRVQDTIWGMMLVDIKRFHVTASLQGCWNKRQGAAFISAGLTASSPLSPPLPPGTGLSPLLFVPGAPPSPATINTLPSPASFSTKPGLELGKELCARGLGCSPLHPSQAKLEEDLGRAWCWRTHLF